MPRKPTPSAKPASRPRQAAAAPQPPGLPPSYASGRRIARLTATLFTQPQGIALVELSEMLEISLKSAERYLNAIAEEFPGQLEREGTGSDRRIRLRREQPNVSQLGMYPFAAAFFAGQFLNWVQGSRLQDDYAATLKRLEARMGERADVPLTFLANKFCFFPRAPKDLRLHRGTLDTVVEALLGEWEMDISYANAAGELRRYPAFQPLTLAAYQEGLYLIGQKRGGKHRFLIVIERIRSAERLDSHFEYPHNFDPQSFRRDAFGLYQGTPQAVELRFAPHLSEWVRSRRWHPSQKIALETDGSLRLSIRASGDADLVSWILGFGPAVEVLAPVELRERVATELLTAAQRYAAT
jgi:predicted DNA-binding transcriptional regulator YafY